MLRVLSPERGQVRYNGRPVGEQDRRHRGAARLGRLVDLSPRPAHHRSPGEAARDDPQTRIPLAQLALPLNR